MALSYSQLQRYRTCPRQYEFSNVKKIPWGISEGESFGASVHNALKKWGELEAKGAGVGLGNKKKGEAREDQMILFEGEARPLPQSELTEDKIVALWHECFIVDTYATRLEADFARKRGEGLMRQFFQWWVQSPRSVLAVEKAFRLEIDGLTLTGRLDRVEKAEGGVRIIDYKTTEPRSQEEADADVQLSVYALASRELFEEPCTELLFLFLSEEGIVERTTTRSASQLRDAQSQIRMIHERLEAKDFKPTPSARVCRRCPYRGICDVAAA
ncbi:MAG: PD-(D/E)XK nuclease family protein [Candidatus Peribacteraceae bacterium]|nr:PD-(D/E)XK nuclease family protein [Candidatus Peribacteraceae bacterium]